MQNLGTWGRWKCLDIWSPTNTSLFNDNLTQKDPVKHCCKLFSQWEDHLHLKVVFPLVKRLATMPYTGPRDPDIKHHRSDLGNPEFSRLKWLNDRYYLTHVHRATFRGHILKHEWEITLTHWPLGNLNEILDMLFSNGFQWLTVEASLVKLT